MCVQRITQVQRFELQAGTQRVSLRKVEGGTMQIIGAGLTLEGTVEQRNYLRMLGVGISLGMFKS